LSPTFYSFLAGKKRVRCPTCKYEIAANAKFCVECGVSLLDRCPNCSHDNPPVAKFCVECGAALTAPIPFTSKASAATSSSAREDVHGGGHGGPSGERRHLTVLFCDLVGSTEIAARLDPEEWHEIAREYQREASLTVDASAGTWPSSWATVSSFISAGRMLTTMILNAECEPAWLCFNQLPG
jgi:hypothetical protein